MGCEDLLFLTVFFRGSFLLGILGWTLLLGSSSLCFGGSLCLRLGFRCCVGFGAFPPNLFCCLLFLLLQKKSFVAKEIFWISWWKNYVNITRIAIRSKKCASSIAFRTAACWAGRSPLVVTWPVNVWLFSKTTSGRQGSPSIKGPSLCLFFFCSLATYQNV